MVDNKVARAEFQKHVEFYMQSPRGQIPAHFAALGLMGEIGEYCDTTPGSQEEVTEAGDVAWYFTALGICFGFSLQEIAEKRTSDELGLRSEHKICEMIKKNSWHGVAFASEDMLCELHNCWAFIMDWDQGEYEAAVYAANIKKLTTRYPNGFVEGGGIR